MAVKPEGFPMGSIQSSLPLNATGECLGICIDVGMSQRDSHSLDGTAYHHNGMRGLYRPVAQQIGSQQHQRKRVVCALQC